MGTLREWSCSWHGEFDNATGVCEACGDSKFVRQEIRTAPALKGRSTKFIDGQLREIADDNGLTDLRNDPKAGVSVLQSMIDRKNLANIEKPRWGTIEHAAPGFSRDQNAKVPSITAESMGFVPTPAAKMNFPPPPTKIVGRYSGD